MSALSSVIYPTLISLTPKKVINIFENYFYHDDLMKKTYSHRTPMYLPLRLLVLPDGLPGLLSLLQAPVAPDMLKHTELGIRF